MRDRTFAFTITAIGLLVVPPNGSIASGYGVGIVDSSTNTLDYDITEDVAEETAASINGFATRGMNAGILVALPAGAHKVGTWSYPDSMEASILAGLTYVNIQSTAFPDGEIRGQLEPAVTVSGVESGGKPEFALRHLTPNPIQQALRVAFGLPDASPAKVEVFNVSGRLVATREVGSLGPGSHAVTLDERAQLASGVYIVRLTQGGRSLTTRAVIVR